jgi:myo-inositol-1(or 4)-monophosphatase
VTIDDPRREEPARDGSRAERPALVPRLVAVAEEACEAAVRLLRERWAGGGAPDARVKGRFDVVTAADTAVEDLLAARLTAAVPGSAVVGEERGARAAAGAAGAEVTWYVDPIDGTGNFLRGLPLACVSVGAVVGGRPVAGCVHDVFRGERFSGGEGVPTAVRPVPPRPGPPGRAAWPLVLTDVPLPGRAGPAEMAFLADLLDRAEVRRVYCTALSLAWVAAGRADAACNLGVRPWDTAAGAALVRAAGGVYRPVDDGTSGGGHPAWPGVGFVAAGPGADPGLAGWLAGRLTGLARPGAGPAGGH